MSENQVEDKLQSIMEQAESEATKEDYKIPDFLDLEVLSKHYDKPLYDLVQESYMNYAIARTDYYCKKVYETAHLEGVEQGKREVLSKLYLVAEAHIEGTFNGNADSATGDYYIISKGTIDQLKQETEDG